MSHPCLSYGRLTTVSGILALAFAGFSTAAGFGAGAASPSASVETACSRANARTPAALPEKSCKGTPSAASGSRQSTYSYQTLDYPGASQTIFWGLNDFNELAGQYSIAGGTAHAMTYRYGRFEPLDPERLGQYFSAAGGPTDVGATFGGYADASGLQHGFVIRRGQFETVDFPSHLNSNVDGVNLFRTILGVYWDADGIFHGVLRHDGKDTPVDVPGAVDTYPLGINDEGESVGFWDTNPSLVNGFYRSANGQFSILNVPDASRTVAFAINNRGQIAGYFRSTSGAIHGFLKTGMKFQDIDMPGAAVTVVTAINNSGSVAGYYVDTAGNDHGFLATPW
jgi:uncharacterized membrane protein